MANIDTDKLHKTLGEFLENKFWAKYYGEAPSVAKEFIALEMYASDNDVDDDEDFDKLQKEIEESMEDEDKKYLAENSPSQYERARFAKMLSGGGDGGGSEDDEGSDDDSKSQEGGEDEGNHNEDDDDDGEADTVIDDDGLKMDDNDDGEDDDKVKVN